jgi:autotransporter-associated beta strand protein
VTNVISASSFSPGAGTGFIMVGDNTNNTVTTYSGPITFGTATGSGGNFAGPVSSGYLNISSYVSAPGVLVIVRYGNVRFAGGGDCNQFDIRANTTSLGANNGLPTNAPVDIGGNGSTTVPTYLDLNGYNQAIPGVKNAVNGVNLAYVTNSGAVLSTLTLNPGTGNTYSFGGGVVGKVALVLNSGQQIFTGTVGTNAYSGNTTVNGGILELANDSIATNSTVTIATGATLQLDFSTTNQIGALVLGGANQSPGVYNNTTSPTFITGSGSLIVVPPVNTTPTNITAAVTGSTLTLSWPADHTGWKLQAQTNSLGSGLGTNWVTIPGTDSSNTYNATLNPANGAVFYRMVYP